MINNYDLDLFVNISKYKPTVERSPLENFTTELFVYVLKDLIRKKNDAALELLKLFGIDQIEDIEITTQNVYYDVNKKPLKPDIKIELVNKVIFVEVKVNSDLIKYDFDRKLIDQLEAYQKIKLEDKRKTEVYSLTRDRVVSSVKNNIRWHQISGILEKINGTDQIIDNFFYFLKENKMGKLEKLSNDTSSVLKFINGLTDYISRIYDESDFSGNKKYKLGTVYLKRDGIGYYIMDSNVKKSNGENNSFYWIGINNKNNNIVFQILSSSLKQEYANNWEEQWELDEHGCHPVVEFLAYSEITKLSSIDEQVEKGKEWLNSIYETLSKYVKRKLI